MNRKDNNLHILNALQDTYFAENNEPNFCWDGPSNWDFYYSSKPRIMFLLKEPRNDFQPSVPNQKIDSKFMMNISRWKTLIQRLVTGNFSNEFIDDRNLSSTIDDIAIVEVKKIDEGNISSNNSVLRNYTKRDKSFLVEQINNINPHIIVCCGTVDFYDIIFEDLQLQEKKLSACDGKYCWDSNNRVVIDFYHPTTYPVMIPSVNKKDRECFSTLHSLISNIEVQNRIQEIVELY